MRALIAASLIVFTCSAASAQYRQRLNYLDENNPYYPGLNFPKLITPQWVGEEGVDAVIILGIDDMRDTATYERYLRPVLTRLKKIDGRAPVSIMTNKVKPEDPQLQSWLDEGLSLECHTVDHPCPLLKDGDFDKAKSTYDRCIDMMASIPRNKPVAFRMPCCDSLNTVSPRFFSEIFNKTTEKKNYLTIDTSVFQFFTSDDPDIPRELIIDADGQDKFLKYMPKDRGFVNYIENYPYPYVINKLCWEFPCVAPSDWSAQHKHGVNNQVTVDDWKAAIDITVIKKGVMCLVFHPHGWIKPEQIVELIDHARAKHGKKVKFLTFKEASRRLDENFLRGRKMRPLKSQWMRYDIDTDRGHVGITFQGSKRGEWPDIWVWEDRDYEWAQAVGGNSQWKELSTTAKERWVHGPPTGGSGAGYPYFTEAKQRNIEKQPLELDTFGFFANVEPGNDDSGPFYDLEQQLPPTVINRIRTIAKGDPRTKLFSGDGAGVHVDHVAGLRLVDLNKDGFRDVVYSDAERIGVFLFDKDRKGWPRAIVDVERGSQPRQLPPIVNADFSDNGFFIHGDAMYWMNEDTAKEPHLVVKRTFAEILAAGKKVGRAPPTNPREKQTEATTGSAVGSAHPTAKSPQASLNCIDVREGFKVELVAAEPLIRDPIAFDWLPDGRMIVVEMGGYPNGVGDVGSAVRTKTDDNTEAVRTADPTNGRVRILDDTDNDGVYDKATTFLDGLNFPTGVMPWRNGVLISAAPDISYAEDTDGDGKAEKGEVLFTGFKEGNQQHRVNGFEYGLDNWVYVANGDSGGTIKSIKTGKTLDIRSNDIRIKPDTGEMERVTGRTQYGRHRDAYGNWFGCNNSNPMWHYVLDEKYISRNKHFAPGSLKHVVPEVPGNAPIFPISTTPERFNDFHTANRFTSACSTIVYDDDLFGPHFKRNAFICEPVHNLISRLVLEPNGVTFTGKRAVDEQDREFLASTDNWFRPVFARTGPDGALWIADMYRHVIEHPKWIPEDWQKKLDLRAGHDKGRIYRVVPVMAKPMRELVRFPVKGAPEELESPTRWVRDTAHHRLTDQTTLPEDALELLKDWNNLRRRFENAEIPMARIQILSALDGRHKKWWESGPQVILQALNDTYPDVRRHGIRLSQRYPDHAAIRSRLIELAKDPAPAETLELAYRLGEYNSPDAADALAKLVLSNSNDQFVEAAVLSSVNETNLPRLMKVALNPEIPLGFAKAVFETAVRSKDAGLIETGLEALVNPDVLKNRETKERAIVVAAAIFERARSAELPGSASLPTDKESQAAIEQLVRLVSTAARDRYCKQHSPELVIASIQIMGAIARGKGTKLEADDAKNWTGAMSVSIPQAVQLAVIDEIARYRGGGPVAVFVQNWKNATPAVRARMFSHVMSKGDWISQLLIHLTDGDLKSSDFTAAQRAKLLNHKEDWIRESASESFGKLETTNRQALATKFADSLKPGDAAVGRAVFEKRCATCHRLNGVGRQIGADLASLKDKSTKALLTAILDPNRAVEAKFLSYTAVTEDGKSHSGMIKSETGTAITLIGSDGTERTVLRSQIDEFTGSDRSLMPEGLERDMTAADLANVIAFVQSRGVSLAKRFAGNTPRTIQPANDGSLRLTARDCEIYGPSLVFESHYGNLGFWASQGDHAVWRLSGVEPGRYRVRATVAAPANVLGQQFGLSVGSKLIRTKVPATGSWDNYRTIDVGEILIEENECTVRIQSVGEVTEYLMDLREVVFAPSKPGK